MLINQFKGEIYRTNQRIIVGLPSEAWIKYGNGEMNFETAHNFEQIAWVQVCQFHARDLQSAIKDITYFRDATINVKTWQQHYSQNQHKITYLQLLYKTKVYLIFEKWIREESRQTYYKETKCGCKSTSEKNQEPWEYDEIDHSDIE